MKIIKKLFFLSIIFVFFVFFYGVYQLNKPFNKKDNGVFIIKEGTGVNEISQNLYQNKFIDNRFIFETYVWLIRSEGKFIAGKYNIPSHSNIKDIVRLLTSKRKKDEIVLRFIEGWDVNDIKNYLLEKKIIRNEKEFDEWNKISKWKNKYSYLQDVPDNLSLEGFLFPDTYNFFIDVKPKDIIDKMLGNFDRKISEKMKSDISAKGNNFYDVVILASIIEKEVPNREDMMKVADIFYKRMKIGMMLQADSTLNYIIKGNSDRLTSEQLKIDSPYNSYKYKDLPPTPICNPGLNAIKASIYPQKNDYYFFLTDKKGKVYYAKTLKEHNFNHRYLD